MSQQAMAAWECPRCEVAGRSPEAEPRCWNCDGPVVVTARLATRGGPALSARPGPG